MRVHLSKLAAITEEERKERPRNTNGKNKLSAYSATNCGDRSGIITGY